MAKAKENLPAIPEKSYLEQLDDALAQEAQGFNPIPIRMKVLHMEGRFQIEGLDAMKRLNGVVLASKMVRVFFPRLGSDKETEDLLTLTGSRPLCRSADYAHGELADLDWKTVTNENAVLLKQKIAEGGGTCAKCPLSAWESVRYLGQDGRGTACKELRRLLYWESGMTIPVILSVPTSSIRNWDAYCSALEAAGLKHRHVVTEISAEVRESPGRKWSVLSFEKSNDVTDEMAEELVANVVFKGQDTMLVKALVDLFLGRELTVDDYPENGTKGEEDF